MKKFSSLRVLVLVGLLALGLSACGGGGGASKDVVGVFVGTVPNSDAFVAIVATNLTDPAGTHPQPGDTGRRVAPASIGSDRHYVVAYVCDGHQIDEWFAGVRTGNSFVLGSDTQSLINVELSDDAAKGTVSLWDGTSLDFSAEPPTGDAGFYKVDTTISGERYRGGWIVLPDGRQTGKVRRGNGTASTLLSVPPLNTSNPTVSVGGVTLTPMLSNAEDFPVHSTIDVK